MLVPNPTTLRIGIVVTGVVGVVQVDTVEMLRKRLPDLQIPRKLPMPKPVLLVMVLPRLRKMVLHHNLINIL